MLSDRPFRYARAVDRRAGQTRQTASAITADIERGVLRVGDYSRQSTRVMARLPDAEEARLLRQPRNRPVLVTKAVSADIDGEPIGFGIARFASDRVQILVESVNDS